MAGPSKKDPDTGVLSAEYMTSLQKLCRLSSPTVGEVSSIFTGDFRRTLGGARARPSVRAEAPAAPQSRATPSTSRGSKKRGGQSALAGTRKGRGRKGVAREEPDDEDEPKSEDVGFARPCTWEADSPCWLRSELQEWNRLLAKGFFELQEHVWSEFTFNGYLWSQIDMPEESATLRVSLLVNFLLRHHRCLTKVSVDFAVGEFEHAIFWDGIKNGTGAVTFLEYKGTDAQYKGLAPKEEYQLWAQCLSSLTNLRSLHLVRVFIDFKVAEALADFMEDTTTLVTLSLRKIKPEEKVVGCLLEALTMNKSMKNFSVSEEFAMAQDGKPLAYFVKNHTVIHTLEVNGGGVCVPSAILRAAVLAPSLKCLKIHECKILADDINEMSKALTRRPPSREPSPIFMSAAEGSASLAGVSSSAAEASPGEGTSSAAEASPGEGTSSATEASPGEGTSSATEASPGEGTSSAAQGAASVADGATPPESPTHTSGLEKLCFFDIANSNPILEESYASLIGGVLLDLTFYSCHLEETFATAAAQALTNDSRLRTLDLLSNPIPVTGCTAMIEALRVNDSLKTLSINVIGMHAANVMTPFFQAIRESNAASRLKITWIQPSGSDFARSAANCRTSMVLCKLDSRLMPDAGLLLDAVRTSTNNFAATIECSVIARRPVLEKLVEICGRTKFLSDLTLKVHLSENDGLDLIKSLERNRTVRVLTLSNFLFRKRGVRALGQMVTKNRYINELTVSIQEGGQEWNQMKSACRELKEAILSNRMLTLLNVELLGVNLASEFAIKDTLRSNMMYVHEAAYFVKGSNERSHAAAFESLKTSYSLKKAVRRTYSITDDQAVAKIEDAYQRFAANYFVLTGVVKERVRCERHPKGLATLEEFNVKVLTHLCQFLSLSDVLQV